MPERGHTHKSRRNDKEALARARRLEEKTKHIQNIIIPQTKNEFIVAIDGLYKGGTIVNVMNENNIPLKAFIPSGCRMNKRGKQVIFKSENDKKTEYLLVEKSELPISTAGNCNLFIKYAYTNKELEELTKDINKNEFWYWSKWLNEYVIKKNNVESNEHIITNNVEGNEHIITNNVETPSDINFDGI